MIDLIKKNPAGLNGAGPKFGEVVGDIVHYPMIFAIRKIQHGQDCVWLRRTNNLTCDTYVPLTEICD
jgi:hypothetical protein